MDMKPFRPARGQDPAGVDAYVPPRSLSEAAHIKNTPSRTNDLYNGKFEKIDGKPKLRGPAGKLK